MSPKNSTIQQLRENVRTWNSPSGDIFYIHNVQMSDGVQGYALGKKETAPYQIGDAVTYEEVKQTQDGMRLKISKEYNGQQTSGGSNGYKKPYKDVANIQRQSALKIASFMLGSGKPLEDYMKTAEACLKFFSNEGDNTRQIETRNNSNLWEANSTSNPF